MSLEQWQNRKGHNYKSATYAKVIQDKATVKAMIKNDPERAVEIIENRIRTINYLEN